MPDSPPSYILGFNGLDFSLAKKLLLGHDSIRPSKNGWDWLGNGIYFWEQNPLLALDYATNVRDGTQYSKGNIDTPVVVGAVISLGNCFNLTSSGGTQILKDGYNSFLKLCKETDTKVPKNKKNPVNQQKNIRLLDAAVIEHVHIIREHKQEVEYDTVRGAFAEGDKVYPHASITEKNHIQICVRTESSIKGYFLPQPMEKYNPHWDPKLFE